MFNSLPYAKKEGKDTIITNAYFISKYFNNKLIDFLEIDYENFSIDVNKKYDIDNTISFYKDRKSNKYYIGVFKDNCNSKNYIYSEWKANNSKLKFQKLLSQELPKEMTKKSLCYNLTNSGVNKHFLFFHYVPYFYNLETNVEYNFIEEFINAGLSKKTLSNNIELYIMDVFQFGEYINFLITDDNINAKIITFNLENKKLISTKFLKLKDINVLSMRFFKHDRIVAMNKDNTSIVLMQ